MWFYIILDGPIIFFFLMKYSLKLIWKSFLLFKFRLFFMRKLMLTILFLHSLHFFVLFDFNFIQTMRKILMPLRIPRADVSFKTSSWTFASSSLKKIWQIFRIHISKKFFLVVATKNLNFFFGLIVNPHFNDCPNSCKKKGSI